MCKAFRKRHSLRKSFGKILNTMALQRAISAIEEDHVSYIMQLPEVDVKQLIGKTDEDGRWHDSVSF
jgi:hypothetical protein